MQNRSACLLTLLVAAQAVTIPALAQGGAEELKKQESLPPMTDASKPDQGGKPEPGAKVLSSAGNTAALINGTLAVPGASADVDTVPAKYSPRTAADDAMPIVGYRLKSLGEDAKEKLRSLVRGQPPAQDLWATQPVLGAEVPSTVIAKGLAPVPPNLVSEAPELKGAAFVVQGDKLVLIDPVMRTVIGLVGP